MKSYIYLTFTQLQNRINGFSMVSMRAIVLITARLPDPKEVCSINRVTLFFADHSKAVLLLLILYAIMFHICLCYAILHVPCRLVITCLEKHWLLCVCVCVCVCVLCVFCVCFYHFPIWCPGSGVVLDCIDSWSLPSSLLSFRSGIT